MIADRGLHLPVREIQVAGLSLRIDLELGESRKIGLRQILSGTADRDLQNRLFIQTDRVTAERHL